MAADAQEARIVEELRIRYQIPKRTPLTNSEIIAAFAMAKQLAKKQRRALDDGPCVGRQADYLALDDGPCVDEHYDFVVPERFEGRPFACHYYWGCTQMEYVDYNYCNVNERKQSFPPFGEHRGELRYDDQMLSSFQLQLSLGRVFKLRSTTALVANMPVDTALKQSVVNELKKLRFHCVVVPAGICGKDVVRSSKQSDKHGVCELRFTEEGEKMMGKSRISIRTKQPPRSVGAFGCAMTHRNLLLAVAYHHTKFQQGMDSYAAIFEDDIHVPRSAAYTTRIVETCVGLALAGQTVPDIIYLFAHTPVCAQPLTVFAKMNNPISTPYKSGACDQILLVRTKCAYGCQGFLIKRSAAKIVLKYSESGLQAMWTSDGGMRRACTSGELVAAHFVSLPAHASRVEAPSVRDLTKFKVVDTCCPSHKGGSRVTV